MPDGTGQPPGRDVAAVAASVAGGASIVLVGALADQVLRLGVTWYLARALGAEGFGLYTWAVTVAMLLGAIAPLGVHQGVVLFASRARADGRADEVKGTLLAARRLALLSGGLIAGALLAVSALYEGLSPAQASALQLVAAAIPCNAVLLVRVAMLRVARDARAQALSFQIALPATMLAVSVAAVALGAGPFGAMFAYLTGVIVAALSADAASRRHFGALLADAAVTPVSDTRKLLAFSIPQGVTDLLIRLSLWIDVLLLSVLATLHDVGLYRVAVSFAMLGSAPVLAIHSMFNPIVAELVHAGRLDDLNALVRQLTRWLVAAVLPVFAVAVLIPDVILGLVDDSYVASAPALVLLLCGQAIYVSCALAVPLNSMAGRSRLELTNGLAAIAVNVGLNVVLVPRVGPIGAAIASATALTAWSALRVFEARKLLRVWPFAPRTVGMIAGLAGMTTLASRTVGDADVATRIAAAAVLVAVHYTFAALFGREPGDAQAAREILGRFRRRRVR